MKKSVSAVIRGLAILGIVLTLSVAVSVQAEEGVAPPEKRALRAPEKGSIKVAFVMTDGATMIDFAGPWEVFQDVHVEGRASSMEDQMAFELFTVGQSLDAIRTSGGMQVKPDFTFETAPTPHIVVLGAQRGSKDLVQWVRTAHEKNAVILSVCTGAFKLAQTGLLDGKAATTHHDFFDQFAKAHPKVRLQRGKRFVKADDRIYSAGGLTSGIDLALHIVELYFGRGTAMQTATYMEYESDGWRRPQ